MFIFICFISALTMQSPKIVQPTASMKKRNWNSSVKVENKSKSHTADGQLKYKSVRKVLNFQPKAKVKIFFYYFLKSRRN